MDHLIGFLGIAIVFGGIIAIHEFGHFIVAKLSGMTVHEFSIGFGPIIFNKVKNGTRYSLRALPLGGFVRIAGMEPGEENEPNGFNSKSFFPKFMTIFAGALMNIVLALILFTAIGMTYGWGDSKSRIGEVLPNSPAERAGLQAGDRIVEVAGIRDPNPNEVGMQIQLTRPPVPIIIERNGELLTYELVPERKKGQKQRLIGIKMDAFDVKHTRYGLGGALVQGAVRSYDLTAMTVKSLYLLVTGQVSFDQLSGPLNIMRATHEVSRETFDTEKPIEPVRVAGFLHWFAVISLSIGIFNLLPFPVLDGSHLLIITLEGIRRKEFDPNKKAMIHMVGFALLIALFLFITGREVLEWMQGKSPLGG